MAESLRNRRGIAVATAIAATFAPVHAQAAPAPEADAVRALCAELDAAFEARDPDRWFAPFRPVHPTAHARFAARLRRVLAAPVDLERTSTVDRHWQLGDRGVSLITAVTRAPARPGMPTVREHSLLVTAHGAGGALRALLVIDVDDAVLAALPAADEPLTPKHSQRCTTCNYTIAAGADWLLVPHGKQSSGCLEALSFWALDTELRVDLTVHLARDDEPQAAEDRLAALVAALHPAAAGPIDTWLPPAYRAATPGPTLLTGARTELRDGDQRTELALAVHGRLGYLFAICGDEATLQRGRDAIGRLLATFLLVDPDAAPDDIVARITTDRQGGELVDDTYRNALWSFECRAPGDWAPRLAAGHYAFDVVWTCPYDQGRMRVKGMEPPLGAERWTSGAADRMVQTALTAGGLTVVEDSGWRAGSGGFAREREVVARRGAAPPRYALRLVMADDLLVLAEADANTDHGLDVVRQAFDTLRRER